MAWALNAQRKCPTRGAFVRSSELSKIAHDLASLTATADTRREPAPRTFACVVRVLRCDAHSLDPLRPSPQCILRFRSVLTSAVLLLVVIPNTVTGQQAGKKKKALEGKAATPAAPTDSGAIVLPTALKARSIGPAVMGGRVSSIAIDPANPYTFYAGLATGGIMKSSDNGSSFEPIFEHEAVAAIGDIAIAPSDPKTIYVGTGEANDRNTVSWGAGVYTSTDGGATWTKSGLEKTRAIARVVVHPTDPKTAWVCSPGDVWQPGERGIYKTTDGGKSWKKVYTAPAPFETRAGCGDLAIDPSDPNILYATLYARLRRPWVFTYGVQASDGKDIGGVLKSTDGGATWTKLTNGLPTMTGRIGLAVYAKNPKTVYALVQSDAGGTSDIDDPYSKAGGVFRSDDAGATWTRQSKLDPRPFYFSQIRVDPENDKRVYVLGFMLHVSDDGGKTWREDRFKNVHSDNHALAIDPHTPSRMLLGTDGGLYESYNGAEGWAHLEPLRRRRVLSREHRQLCAVSHLRRAAGQHELGRPERHAEQGRDSQRGLARDRRRRRVVLPVRSG